MSWLGSVRRRATESLMRYFPYVVPIAAFTAPLFVFVGLDLNTYDAGRPLHMPEFNNQTLPDAASPFRYLLWIGFLLNMFLLYRFLMTMWGASIKHENAYGESVARLLYDGSILYVVAGARDKIYWTEQRIPDYVFLALIALYSLVYSAVFFASKRFDHRIVLKRDNLTPSMVAWVILPGVGAVAAAVVYHLMTAWRVSPEFFGVYVTVVLVWIAGHAAAYAWYSERLHLHHWYWGLYAAHACIFNTDASIMCQAAFVAVYLHGMAVYGPTSIFEPEEKEPYSEIADVHI